MTKKRREEQRRNGGKSGEEMEGRVTKKLFSFLSRRRARGAQIWWISRLSPSEGDGHVHEDGWTERDSSMFTFPDVYVPSKPSNSSVSNTANSLKPFHRPEWRRRQSREMKTNSIFLPGFSPNPVRDWPRNHAAATLVQPEDAC